MFLNKNVFKIALLFGAFLMPMFLNAQIEITEIMYDLEGADTKKEWIEICNTGNENIDITGWKFNDGSNHNLSEPPKNGGQGSLIINSKECSILTSNAETFLSLNSGYTKTVIDTVMSLNNTEDTLIILNSEGLEIDSVNYNKEMGANGDGNSLQKVNNQWISSLPSIGDFNFSVEEQNNSDESNENEEDNNNQENSNETEEIGIQSSAEKRISVDAGENRKLIVGADSLFEAKAFGIQNKPLKNARYIWNFGDGTRKERYKVLHTYSHTGDYIVFLDVVSGEYSATDKIYVSVISADLVISNIKSGKDGFVEIHNRTKEELDLSFWKISNGNDFFMIPKNTFISSDNKVLFSSQNTGLILENNDVKLLYPNGSLSDSYNQPARHASEAKAGEEIKKTTKQESSIKTKPVSVKSVTKFENDTKKIVGNGNKINTENIKNTSSVINSISEESENSDSIYKWLLAVSIIILISVVGIVIKKPLSKEEEVKSKSDEIEILD